MSHRSDRLIAVISVITSHPAVESPANAGIHFDFALAVPAREKIKIKMDPSVRWDDDFYY